MKLTLRVNFYSIAFRVFRASSEIFFYSNLTFYLIFDCILLTIIALVEMKAVTVKDTEKYHKPKEKNNQKWKYQILGDECWSICYRRCQIREHFSASITRLEKSSWKLKLFSHWQMKTKSFLFLYMLISEKLGAFH